MIGWQRYVAVGVGSALGSVLRWLVSLGSLAALGPAFPWGTLAVNLLGSWLIAAFAAHAAHRNWGRIARWQPFLVAGFCGGFTTFSLFGLETLHLLELGRPGLALLYVVLSVPLWLAAAWWGDRFVRARHG
ncbi:MAG: fluoride efflux transporter CrcB [Halomonas sp.]|jgi:CrcB protein|uniref:Fluoride-specific ion channel FluC n=1 Tax=Billgrantia tianxiuensis TaxID=2497861 RepID=A0A6I6SVE7_9GAMM|nr:MULTISPECIES: fluoride efflux transporter CrcB [Halomonas]MCE8035429.1 fluoride efflux transporter CrcB [Halomonas sp. MCCC 1A11057]MDX5434552.1 fluoride efflux transporter CrcB [Halomonas sp.]MDX5504011.1 fluoride efflux transporter CrcB [Halomonas sp.]QHC51790.1 fluoride efflux transporter CrcB [Halomonas tianxiuensis]